MSEITPTEEKRLLRTQAADYYNQVYPSLKMDDILLESDDVYSQQEEQKTKIALEIPSIDMNPEAGTTHQTPAINPVHKTEPVPPNNMGAKQPNPVAPTQPKPSEPQIKPNLTEQPQVPPQDDKIKALETKMSEIYKALDSAVSMSELYAFKESIVKEMMSMTRDLTTQFEEFKKHTVPERVNFDTEIVYKDKVFGKLCTILDELLIPLFDIVPNYFLVGMSNTKYYQDGSVCNSLTTIGIEVSKDNFQYNFKVDVPILNGVIQAPVYIAKANKLIPLVKSEIQKELNNGYMKSRKEEDADLAGKQWNSNVFEPYVETSDSQKEYFSRNPGPMTGVPSDKWRGNFEPRKTQDGSGGFTVNNPKYGPKF